MQFFKVIIFNVIGLLGAFQCAQANLIVVGNSNIQANHLSSNQLSNLYLGKSSSLGSQTITPINLCNENPSYAKFYKSITGWNLDQVSNYWSQIVFSGQANQPQSVANAQTALAMVATTPGAIAYVDTSNIKDPSLLRGLKVLYGHYDSPVPATMPAKKTDLPIPSNTQLPKPRSSHWITRTNRLNTRIKNTPVKHYPLAAALPLLNTKQDMWPVLIQHFQLQANFNQLRVQQQRIYLLRHRETLDLMLRNSIPYIAYVFQQTQKHHMPSELALLPMIESAYNPYAYSRVGAAGLWQMMPQTASLSGLRISWWYDSRRDVLRSTQAALNYLGSLHAQFHSWLLSLAAYDAGSGVIQSALNNQPGVSYWQLNLSRETESYVPKLLAVASIIAHADQYHIVLPPLPLQPFFTTVTVHSQLDIKEISVFSGITPNLIRYLNPGLRRYATNSEGGYTLLLPTSAVSAFVRNLNRLSGKTHISWQYHEVYPGETLAKIAKDYHTSIAELVRVNSMESPVVTQGEGILVPIHLNAKFTKAGEVGANQQVAQIDRITANDLLSGKLPVKALAPKLDITKSLSSAKQLPWQKKYFSHLSLNGMVTWLIYNLNLLH